MFDEAQSACLALCFYLARPEGSLGLSALAVLTLHRITVCTIVALQSNQAEASYSTIVLFFSRICTQAPNYQAYPFAASAQSRGSSLRRILPAGLQESIRVRVGQKRKGLKRASLTSWESHRRSRLLRPGAETARLAHRQRRGALERWKTSGSPCRRQRRREALSSRLAVSQRPLSPRSKAPKDETVDSPSPRGPSTLATPASCNMG